MAGIEDLEPSISRKMQFGAAQETYLLGDLYRLTKAGLDPNKTIEDIEQERLEKLYEKFPEFRSGEYENDAAVWTGRVGIMASDPIYYAIPFSAATKLTKLGPRLAALSGLGAATGATSGAIQGTARTGEFSLGEVAKNAGIGAAAGPIFYGVGQGLSKVGKTATKLKDPAYRDLVTPNILKTDAPRPVAGVGADVAPVVAGKKFKFTKDFFDKVTATGVERRGKSYIDVNQANKILNYKYQGLPVSEIMKKMKLKETTVRKYLDRAKEAGAKFPLAGRQKMEADARQKAIDYINKVNSRNEYRSVKDVAAELGYKNQSSINNMKLPVKLKTPKELTADGFDAVIKGGNVKVHELINLNKSIRNKIGGDYISREAVSNNLQKHKPYVDLQKNLKSVSEILKGNPNEISKGTTLNKFLKDKAAGKYDRLALSRARDERRRTKLKPVTKLQYERELAGSRRLGIELHHADSKRFNVTTKNLMYVEGRKNRGVIKAAENKINKLYDEREALVRSFVTTGKKPEGYVKRLLKINEEGAKIVNDPKIKGTLNFQEFNPQTLDFVDKGVDIPKTLFGMSGIDRNIKDLTREEIKQLRKYAPQKKDGGAVMDFSKYRDTYADGGTVIKYRTLMKDLAQIIS